MNNKNKIIILISIITGVLLVAFGLTYAAFTYNRTGETSELVLGDIYMKYTENNQLTLSDAMPSSFKLNTLKLPSVTTGYTVNSIMKDQELNTLSRCMAKMSLEVAVTLDSGQTWEGFCKGEEIFEGDTLQASLNNGLASGLTDAGYSDIFIEEGDIYKPNPIMQTQEVHELTVCHSYFKTMHSEISDSDIISFCQGTGTLDIPGSSFQGFIDALPADIPLITSLVNMNVIIQEGDKYIPNPVMQTQTFDELELSVCISEVAKQFTGFDEGTTAETFCKGEGTRNATTFQEHIDTMSPETVTGSFQVLLDANVLLEETLPEVEYSYTNLIVNPNMEGEVLESCKTIITDLQELGYASRDIEGFCKGTAPFFGPTFTSGKLISDLATDTEFLKGDGHQLLRNGVIITDINSPYFEFTISGKNTYSKKDIYYDVVLTHGDNHETRTERIRDDLLRFTLNEVNENGQEITLVSNISLYSLKNGERLYIETIPKNTMEEINKTYRLYMNIAESTVICGGEVSESCDYYTDKSPNWNDVFASVKVSVTGDFNNKELTPYLVNVFKNNAFNHIDTILTDTDGTIYLSGSSETYYKYPSGVMQNTEKIIDYNYVLYSGILWRITAIYPDGTLKLVTENTIGDPIQWGGDGKFINSNVYTYLNNDFLNTLDNYENVIVEDYKWNVAEFVTSEEIGESEYVTAPVGLINSYEYWNSYKNISVEYYKSYLANYQSNSWWLLNNKIAGKKYNYVSNSSGPGFATVEQDTWNATDSLYVRPSIVLRPNVLTSGGDGSYGNPYVINTGNN